MKINFITGGVSSGKTYECIRKINEIKSKEPEARIVMIVPEQYSYAAEKLMTESFGGTGLNNIEVLTFSRMSKRCSSRAVKNYLTPSGKAVLITRAIEKACTGDSIYSGCASKPGFVNTAATMLSEMKRYMLTPEMLRLASERLEEGMLKHKLTAIADIYEEYELLNGGRFLDSEEDLLRLAEIIVSRSAFGGAYIFIDEFSDFLPQHYKVLEALMKKCEEIFITLPIDDKSSSELSAIPEDTKRRINFLAEKNGIACSETRLSKSGIGFKSDEIRFFYENYASFFQKGFEPYPEKTEDITLFAARDPYSETEYAAKRIAALIADEKIRYSDITVVCGGTDNYSSIINAVFGDYKIPYFMDSKLAVTDHPILITVLSIFDIISSDWSYDSVFTYLKSGFIYINDDEGIKPVCDDDIDFLSSYVLKKGIRGKKKWLSDDDWRCNSAGLSDAVSGREAEADSAAEDRINITRKTVVLPLRRFIEKTKGRKTAADFAAALYEFLEEIHLYEGLLSEIQRLNDIGMRNEAEQFSQVWNMLIEVINQTVVTLGSEHCSKEQYRSYLLAGLGECKIGIIPSSVDCVTVTGVDVSVQKNVKAMFVIGATRGEIPPEAGSEGMLADSERERLSELFKEDGNELSLPGEQKAAAEYRFYKILFNAEEKLCISYPVNSFEGDAQVPAQLTYDMKRLFPRLTCRDDLLSELVDGETVYSPKAALDYLLQNRRNKNDPAVAQIYRWFKEHPEWQAELKMAETADNYKQTAAKISAENSCELYKKRAAYSVSRLNEFSSCPFRYFAKNGLRAKEEEIWQIQKFDLGSLMHYAVWRFCNAVEGKSNSFAELKQRWDNLTEEECDEITDSIMAEIKEKIAAAIERDEGKMNYLIDRMTRTLKRSSETIRKSISLGGYIPAEYEKEFMFKPDDEDSSLCIQGIIDRIDIAYSEEDKKAEIRIIDYKSGSKSFSVASVCNMIDIQLVVYAMAAVDLYNRGELKYSRGDFSAEITGILYNKLRDDMARLENGDDDAAVSEAVGSKMKLNGAVVLDTAENGMPDISAALLMDRGISDNMESEYLKFKLTKSGAVTKNSEYLTREQFEKLIEYAKKGIKDYNRRIKGGDIRILPSKDKSELACRWCEMAEICLFDNERDGVRPLCSSNDSAWEIIERETM